MLLDKIIESDFVDILCAVMICLKYYFTETFSTMQALRREYKGGVTTVADTYESQRRQMQKTYKKYCENCSDEFVGAMWVSRTD